MENDDKGEAVCKGTVLDHFVEKDEASQLIAALPTVSDEVVELERAKERFVG